MQDFFLSQLAPIHLSNDSVNHTNCYNGLRFWALLRYVDRVMDLGITTLERCGEETCELHSLDLQCWNACLETERDHAAYAAYAEKPSAKVATNYHVENGKELPHEAAKQGPTLFQQDRFWTDMAVR
jgi:hypothetical protein